MRYFIHFAYNGASFHGWQRQPNANSVQETLEHAFQQLLKKEIQLTAAGRTDAGVHARHMVAHFDWEGWLPENLPFLLNQYLPSAIAIDKLQRVSGNAHARFDALSRTYQYHLSFVKDPFRYPFHYYVKGNLAVDSMNAAANILLEYEDFECFSKVHTDVKTFLCKIEHAGWEYHENELIFTIKANRFLRNMVRSIVGTLIEIGKGKRPLESLHQTLASKSRSQAGYSVPAHALFLTSIRYPETILFTNDKK
ncbi:MAG: tRNA pseudouridine(38-40) synthase TruA [Flavobacteriaceae bacterium]